MWKHLKVNPVYSQGGCIPKSPTLRSIFVALLGVFLLTHSLSAPCHAAIGVNDLGYFNLSFPPGYSMLSNPLDTIYSHSVAGLFGAYAPSCLGVTKLGSDGRPVGTFYTPGIGWSDTNVTLFPCEACLVWNPGTTNVTITFVGVLLRGYLTNDIPAGWSMCGVFVPNTGKLTTHHFFPAANGDSVHFLKPDGTYDTYRFTEGHWEPNEPTIQVGQGFWVSKAVPAKWVRFAAPDSIDQNYNLTSIAANASVSPLSLHQSMPNLPSMPGRVYKAAARRVALQATPMNAVPASFQWQRNGFDLIDGGRIGGTQTDTLVLDNLQLSQDDGVYSVLAANAAGMIKAHVADLRVVLPAIQAPSFNSPIRPSVAGFVQSIQVETGKFYRVQVSDDLQTWIELTNFISASVTAGFVDSSATNQPRRFYRVVSP